MRQTARVDAVRLRLLAATNHCELIALTTLACLALLSTPSFAQTPSLSLDEAVRIAINRSDPSLLRYDKRAQALEHRGVAASQLPDPELQFGLVNWPVDSFDYDQEPMTQIRAGVRQRFPKGQSLKILGQRKEREAAAETARRALGTAQIGLATNLAWYELYYLVFAENIVAQSRDAVAELVEVVLASFTTGLQSSQDLLRAELELSLLDDRELEITRQKLQQRADLARYIGDHSLREIDEALPTFLPLASLQTIDAALVQHASVAIRDEMIAANDLDINLAKEQFKPGFSVDAGYGMRGGDRADFASVMVSMRVPIFPDKRQNKELAASEQEHAAAMFERDTVLLELRRQARRAHADIERLSKRVELYRKVVIKRADGAATAALDGYENQVSDFAELIRARLSALENTLKLKRLEADLGKAHAALEFLIGEQ